MGRNTLFGGPNFKTWHLHISEGLGWFFLRMDGGQADQWELSKENIQPLKQGRSVMKLNNALEQHKDDESSKVVLEERQHFEEELRSYSGEDPLDPWYRYIQVCTFMEYELTFLK